MKQHIPIVGWLNIAHSGIALLVGLFIWILLAGVSTIPEVRYEAGAILHVVGFVFTALMLVIAAPGIIGGIGLLKGHEWARILTIIVSFLNLLAFPLGTIIGIYSLWVLMREETAKLFARKEAV